MSQSVSFPSYIVTQLRGKDQKPGTLQSLHLEDRPFDAISKGKTSIYEKYPHEAKLDEGKRTRYEIQKKEKGKI